MSNWIQIKPIAQSASSRNKTFVIMVKNYTEAVIKVNYSVPIFLGFFTFFQIFCAGL